MAHSAPCAAQPLGVDIEYFGNGVPLAGERRISDGIECFCRFSQKGIDGFIDMFRFDLVKQGQVAVLKQRIVWVECVGHMG